MSVKELHVFLSGEHVGVLSENAGGRHELEYDDGSGPALSVALPRGNRHWSGLPVEAYIDGILPDDPAVRAHIGAMHAVNPRNPFALLTAVGLDCAGAVQFLPEDRLGELDRPELLQPIDEQQIAERLSRPAHAEGGVWQTAEERWSLNGAQDKIALRLDPFTAQWQEALGAAATTHILKPGVTSVAEHAFNETVCMNVAGRLGLESAATTYRVFVGVPAIVSERWDRSYGLGPDGLIVQRIHQEDMCQALSVMTDNKYQSDGGPGTDRILALLASIRAGEESERLFLQALAFNYLIGGTDAHAKNYALLEPGDGSVRLAPLYDIASIFPYGPQRRDRRMAMSIGKQYRWDCLEECHWRRLVDGHAQYVDGDEMLRMLHDMAERLPDVLSQVLDEQLAALAHARVSEDSLSDKRHLGDLMVEGAIAQCRAIAG
ncbi:type II toxin-antitoxin system HipA family toxin [Bifidobacterium choloepi]|uniref:Type II toxin-antitoxin system HipA family toxin n=1 Tax=Bifidobacterium choloepi TaxID=2614131 RepID=A0A6I5NLT2_9BIFI|nr:type II toxin-antitoxin system HipA family toxin [Bifidobacterium choloepi]NEG69732.1 type II toxin-antitoxin system HipA family toxin [Bifidobacterium choloepi]